MLTDKSFDIAEEVTNVARELGATPGAVAIGWLARQPAVSSVILGPRTLDQLCDNLAGFDIEIPTELRERLDTISAPANRPITGMLA
jgi:aryl-alcohol dehydrogenase-like predicted oxidoreductase